MQHMEIQQHGEENGRITQKPNLLSLKPRIILLLPLLPVLIIKILMFIHVEFY